MTEGSRGLHRRVLLLATIALIAVTSLFGRAGAVPRSPEEPAEQMVLRLHDLPPGYYPLDFSEGSGFELICEPLDPVDPSPALASFVRRFTPEGCFGTYLRFYRVPGAAAGAQLVGTGVLDAGSPEGANAGLPLAAEILSLITEDATPTESVTTAAIGDATRLYHWLRVPNLFGKGLRKGSFLAWRSGDVLATVFASAGSLHSSDRIAEELARLQQAHIEHPTPYTRAERNASEVGLDDPALKLPVYWLGRNFAPGHGLPVARLEGGARARYYGERLPNQKLELGYDPNLSLSSWTRAGWRRFLATPRAKEFFAEPCLDSTDLSIAAGSATIYTGHVDGFRPCSPRSPRRFFAVAHLGDVVVAVNLNSCRDCFEPARGSFDSLAGMKAIVRALVVRAKPVY